MNGADQILILHQEIRRNHQARYDHRLHGVLLVLHGMSCQEASRLLGDSARALQYWVKRFEEEGLPGLSEREKTGRPRRLGPAHLRELEAALRHRPVDFGLEAYVWNAKALASYLQKYCGIILGQRQCQRLLRQLGCGSARLQSKTGTTASSLGPCPLCASVS